MKMALEDLHPLVATAWEGYFIPWMCGLRYYSFPPLDIYGFYSNEHFQKLGFQMGRRKTSENVTMREMREKWE
jgi:hypothetical protein